MTRMFLTVAALVLAAGCASCGYRWTADVPEDMRTVAVPNFENTTHDAEIGPIISQYILREFQREGTFRIRRTADAALELQGVVDSANSGGTSFDRSFGNRAHDYRYKVGVTVAFVDKRNGRVLADRRRYTGQTSYVVVGTDMLTARRNAAFRIAQDIARQIVDDARNLDYGKHSAK